MAKFHFPQGETSFRGYKTNEIPLGIMHKSDIVGYFETDDKKLIEMLRENTNCQELTKKMSNREIKQEKELIRIRDEKMAKAKFEAEKEEIELAELEVKITKLENQKKKKDLQEKALSLEASLKTKTVKK